MTLHFLTKIVSLKNGESLKGICMSLLSKRSQRHIVFTIVLNFPKHISKAKYIMSEEIIEINMFSQQMDKKKICKNSQEKIS